jgi:hypothetical protein
MAGTIVTDRIESDASYASSITVASPLVVSNTISLGSAAAITGNLNIDNGTLFVNQNNNRVGVGGIVNPTTTLDVNTSVYITENAVANSNTELTMFSRFSDNQRGYVILKAESNSSGSSDLVIRSRNNFSEAEKFRIDSVGRISVPLQPSFLVSKTNGSQSSGTLVFNSVQFNVGSCYNNSTGRFTAPITGKYLFAFYGITGLVEGNTYINLNKNNSPYGISTYAGGTSSYYRNLSFSVILDLNVNDYIELVVGAASVYAAGDGGNPRFSGILLG